MNKKRKARQVFGSQVYFFLFFSPCVIVEVCLDWLRYQVTHSRKGGGSLGSPTNHSRHFLLFFYAAMQLLLLLLLNMRLPSLRSTTQPDESFLVASLTRFLAVLDESVGFRSHLRCEPYLSHLSSILKNNHRQ